MAAMGLTVAETPFRSCGSDDFSEYGSAAASLMCFVGTGRSNGVGLHHGAYLPGRDSLALAAQAFACAAMRRPSTRSKRRSAGPR